MCVSPEGAQDPRVEFLAVDILVVVTVHLEQQHLQASLGLGRRQLVILLCLLSAACTHTCTPTIVIVCAVTVIIMVIIIIISYYHHYHNRYYCHYYYCHINITYKFACIMI